MKLEICVTLKEGVRVLATEEVDSFDLAVHVVRHVSGAIGSDDVWGILHASDYTNHYIPSVTVCALPGNRGRAFMIINGVANFY